MSADAERERRPAIEVKFSYWGLASDPVSVSREMEVPAGTTLAELLSHLSVSLGRDLRAETSGDGARFLVVNGVYCAVPSDLSRVLVAGDDVRLLPFVAGG
jgi:molybdopterin converting factor small subunit